jgi:phosphatidylserine/phosphatidylglycerophosphate/cardiolipin synthase-like enzyme
MSHMEIIKELGPKRFEPFPNGGRINMLEFITDEQIYKKVICERIPNAKRFLWLATAGLKDLHVEKQGRMVPLLEVLSDLVKKKVEIRLLHAKEPGPAFRADFDRYPNLIKGMERILCPRVHVKSVIIDSKFAYTGSANLTGAGMGAKSTGRRNFESGIITDDKVIIGRIIEQFDSIWRGEHCRDCKRKEFCADYKDLLL